MLGTRVLQKEAMLAIFFKDNMHSREPGFVDASLIFAREVGYQEGSNARNFCLKIIWALRLRNAWALVQGAAAIWIAKEDGMLAFSRGIIWFCPGTQLADVFSTFRRGAPVTASAEPRLGGHC